MIKIHDQLEPIDMSEDEDETEDDESERYLNNGFELIDSMQHVNRK
jgi:hypothetical protein